MTILGMRGCGTLGDVLWLTPAMKVRDDIIVEFHDDAQSRWVAPVLDGLCKYRFVENPAERLYLKGDMTVPVAQRILNYLNITGVNCIPKIKITQEERDWAFTYLIDTFSQVEDLIVIVNDNSGCKDPDNIRAHYVRPPVEKMQSLCYELLRVGRQPVQLGEKDRITELDGALFAYGFTVRQLAACYQIIGDMISGDTGNYHLMLAVGGKCTTLIPGEHFAMGYSYQDLLYLEHLWLDETPRVKYINYNSIKSDS